MNLKNRIVELRKVKAHELAASQDNWRIHPQAQRGALTAILEDIGFVGAILARQIGGGKLEILDGHLRADIAREAEVPVLVTDLNDEEARKLLLTYDPISAAADANSEMLNELIGTVELPDHADLRKLVADLSWSTERKSKQEQDDHEVEGMALRPHEHYDYVVVLASTTHDWNKLCDYLGIVPVKRKRKRSIGVCRAIRAEALLALLEQPKPKAATKKKTTRKKKARRK